MRHLSIRRLLIGWAVLSAAIAIALASLGVAGVSRLSSELERVRTLDQALRNHNDADAFMDNVRTDVLRALQSSSGTNKEGETFIRAELKHHFDVIETAITENNSLRLGPAIGAGYDRIAKLVGSFVDGGQAAVELALKDPMAGASNFERFRHGFADLEGAMDSTRELLRADVHAADVESSETARAVRDRLGAATIFGLLLFAAVSAAAIQRAHRMTGELAGSQAQARHLALHDALTGLPNRAFFANQLAQALARSRRGGTDLAVLCLDLDQFKTVNDTLGHPIGDALLRAVAERLSRSLREEDTVARLGGDEFAIIQAPIAAAEEAGALARRLVQVIGASYEIDGHQIVVGASIGIALSPTDSNSPDDLIKKADMALYRAKADGRGIFRSFERGMDARLQERRLLELDLRRAVVAGEFELYYQPILELQSGSVLAFEALLRWHHPSRGIVSPLDFVPLAEETGTIVPLGEWVLKQACTEAVGWPREVRVAVNLSPVQFRGGLLVATVKAALAASGLQPERLELEITEAVLLQDSEETLTLLRELRALGVRIAMDDFGTGYSSLGYLRSFPFDRIKIDRSFVKDLEESADCKAIIRVVTGLGGNLGIATTAEGVETVEQLYRLHAEGCNEAQGFHISKPLPAGEVMNFLRLASWRKNIPPGELRLTA